MDEKYGGKIINLRVVIQQNHLEQKATNTQKKSLWFLEGYTIKHLIYDLNPAFMQVDHLVKFTVHSLLMEK